MGYFNAYTKNAHMRKIGINLNSKVFHKPVVVVVSGILFVTLAIIALISSKKK